MKITKKLESIKMRIMNMHDTLHNETVMRTIIKLNDSIDLGNNYSIDHFVNAMSATQIVEIYESIEEGDIRIVAKGNYGKVELNTCDFDLFCFIKDLYNSIECIDNEYYYQHEI